MATFQHRTRVNRPLEEVFEFFSNFKNLKLLTPESFGMQILTPEVEMRSGAILDYRLRVMGVRFHWRSEIKVWEPGVRFVDVQLKGPYRSWEHEHRFESDGDGCWVIDSVEYQSPGWILAPIVDRLIINRQVQGLFKYRDQRVKELFG